MYAVLSATHAADQYEMALIAQQDAIAHPPMSFPARRLRARGVEVVTSSDLFFDPEGGPIGVATQPLLGRAADVWGYGPSLVLGAAISALSVPALGPAPLFRLRGRERAQVVVKAADRTAATALANTTKNESPSVLISWPPEAEIAARTMR